MKPSSWRHLWDLTQAEREAADLPGKFPEPYIVYEDDNIITGRMHKPVLAIRYAYECLRFWVRGGKP